MCVNNDTNTNISPSVNTNADNTTHIRSDMKNDKDLNTDPGIDLPTDSNVSFNINSFVGNSISIGTNIE